MILETGIAWGREWMLRGGTPPEMAVLAGFLTFEISLFSDSPNSQLSNEPSYVQIG
jgi:hypothetical protein